jgi:hypothetical protein
LIKVFSFFDENIVGKKDLDGFHVCVVCVKVGKSAKDLKMEACYGNSRETGFFLSKSD